jgi:hypothetical protein
MAARCLIGMTYTLYDPASRFRFKQYVPHFRRAGWEVKLRPNRPDRQWHSRLPGRLPRAAHHRLGRAAQVWNRWQDVREAGRCDVIFLSKDLGPGREWLRRELLRRNPAVIYDFDDAIYVNGKDENARWLCERAAWVTPGNAFLAEFARQFTDRVTVVPTVVDTESYLPAARENTGLLRVGWSGSDQSLPSTLAPYLPAIARMQRVVPFEMVVITNTRPDLTEPGLRWSFLPWTEESEVAGLQTLDVGLMPLVDNEFQRGKCGLKIVQYMAVGVPAIASPVGVNAEILLHGRTGFLATSEGEWTEAIVTLAHDEGLRREMGAAARRRCEEEYSIHRWGPVLLDLFERAAVGRGRLEVAPTREEASRSVTARG